MSMEFENGVWTSHGPVARAEDDRRKVAALIKENAELKKKVADLERKVRRLSRTD
ncbi:MULTISPECIES: hypothetical protein [unclassified Cryobacterium]|uniref:hypothetical protein n=1 Tax=unclassified Cryobacterium TaxID=2649013 RepID=UPI002AB42658|nr:MULTISPECIES: hypothetical protein [unclassified Cryobacterium]MDY7542606.1 hypothetical protein [Cryobacterium sp. 5B3]MEB0264726.1 hypothetical protein [Cryobacterium sp. 10I5]MEB0273698.1 hypothetical protein [Cryobacterium sp. 5B3]